MVELGWLSLPFAEEDGGFGGGFQALGSSLWLRARAPENISLARAQRNEQKRGTSRCSPKSSALACPKCRWSSLSCNRCAELVEEVACVSAEKNRQSYAPGLTVEVRHFKDNPALKIS